MWPFGGWKRKLSPNGNDDSNTSNKTMNTETKTKTLKKIDRSKNEILSYRKEEISRGVSGRLLAPDYRNGLEGPRNMKFF